MGERLADLPPEEQVEQVIEMVEEFLSACSEPYHLADWQREWIRNWWLRDTPNPLRRSA